MTLALSSRLEKRKLLGNLRILPAPSHLIDFASNDYLGLAKSKELHAKILEKWSHQQQVGATGSRLLTGNHPYVENLENTLATFHGYEAGLIFNCGYMANIGLLTTIAHLEDLILFDANIHASTRAGIRLSQAKALAFRHNDLEHLEQRLKQNCSQKETFICIESIYSTDGSMAPLYEMIYLAKQYQAHVVVDEAHAVGLFGTSGQGLVAQAGLNKDVFAQVTTFGKALGTHGAIVLGNSLLKQSLINFSPSYIYTTALPLSSLIAIECSYQIFPTLIKERKHLQTLIQLFQKHDLKASPTAIQSIKIKGNEAVKNLATLLAKKGLDVRPLLSPTVQRGQELLRICLHAFNTEQELTFLLQTIEDFL